MHPAAVPALFTVGARQGSPQRPSGLTCEGCGGTWGPLSPVAGPVTWHLGTSLPGRRGRHLGVCPQQEEMVPPSHRWGQMT